MIVLRELPNDCTWMRWYAWVRHDYDLQRCIMLKYHQNVRLMLADGFQSNMPPQYETSFIAALHVVFT